ncbi:unnamed protein product [Cuscuta epithymum]|uniref:Uncharacterized protein n=1 Tax=Cuscuta epithymum TaxID=186058 RepID=A0AAV0FFD6_9ASTE|nr:unnamed protein product [Cuscuta epithymum]
MPGIDPNLICHRLAVRPDAKPIQQKKRYMAAERRDFIKKEAATLLSIKHIRPVIHVEWLANVVLAPKGDTWRMCVDYSDLNKACLMDPYPVPRIDLLVDETTGCELLSFMDAFRGYHQVFMHPDDAEKTAFVTADGVYCYVVMPFGLRNAMATFQRMIGMLFKDVLGKTMEAYVDDILIKSKKKEDHVRDMERIFTIMEGASMRLNPKKCAFAVKGGKFLGYMMSERGIEPNPEKVKAIVDMEAPRNLKDVQRLTGRLAALSRFMSKLADKAIPFFQIMKKANPFEWTPECQAAFEDFKIYLSFPLVLTKADPGEQLYMYLAVADLAVSAVLLKEAGGVQRTIYFVSKALNGPETRYTLMEKTILALIASIKRLAPYFQAHPVIVYTTQPLATILRNPMASGRITKWSLMIGQYNIEFKPRPTIKGQALADFIAECTARTEDDPQGDNDFNNWWEMYTDGASIAKGCGRGAVITSPEGFKAYYSMKFEFKVTNNEAEYEALIAGLKCAKALGAARLKVKMDSQLVVTQMNGTAETREERMKIYKEIAEEQTAQFEQVIIEQVSRVENAEADILSKLGNPPGGDPTTSIPRHIRGFVRQETLPTPATDVIRVETISIAEPNWSKEIADYLRDGTLPEPEDDGSSGRAAWIKRRAPNFELIDGQLYKKTFGGPYLRCLPPSLAAAVIEEIHEGVCSSHQGPRTFARKIILQGYYWPTIQQDCFNHTRKCAVCQQYAPVPGRPASFYTPMTVALPFARWGIDLLGPLPTTTGGRKFVIVAIDYFTKW